MGHLHRDLAFTLISKPGGRAAAIAHGRQALILLERSGNTTLATGMKAWLAKPEPRPLEVD